MLDRMFQRRCRAYESVRYKIIQPASAYPGWPAEVVLPAAPLWKGEHGRSISRLVSDGLDQSLAQLFADVSKLEDNPLEKARSLVEAFLLYRLETLPETRGRFKLNQELSIPFDALGCMEVDLLCEDMHLVIEIDGVQHLESKDAYRRDRRKDFLLQQNGYMVLRFLACDVTKELDVVLDIILRILSRQ